MMHGYTDAKLDEALQPAVEQLLHKIEMDVVRTLTAHATHALAIPRDILTPPDWGKISAYEAESTDRAYHRMLAQSLWSCAVKWPTPSFVVTADCSEDYSPSHLSPRQLAKRDRALRNLRRIARKNRRRASHWGRTFDKWDRRR